MNTYKTIPPCTDMIKGMIDADGMTLKKALAELVVNSIDHDARNIHLEYDRNQEIFVIADDGSGPPRGLAKLIEIGRHTPSKRYPVGRYGVGHKDATCWLANFSRVHAMIRDGEKESLIVDWRHIMAMGEWIFMCSDESIRTAPGLTIQLSQLRAHRFRHWDKVAGYISELFSAAIDDGVVITVDTETVKALPVPTLENRIPFEGVFEGKRFKGFAGILKNKGDAASGWDIRYGPQSVAVGYAKEGFGKVNAQGFYGRFEMIPGDPDWNLNRNKTDSEDLYGALNDEFMQETVIKPLMKHLRSRGETLRILSHGKLASTALTNLFKRVRAAEMENEEEEIPTLDPEGPIIGPDDKREHTPNPGPKPGPGPVIGPLVPSSLIKRKRKVRDNQSNIKDKVRQVQTVNVGPHSDPRHRGMFYLEMKDQGQRMQIYLDDSTPFGKQIWNDPHAVLHYAVMCLASHLGSELDILNQIHLPIGDLGDSADVRISKALEYLLRSVELEQFFETTTT